MRSLGGLAIVVVMGALVGLPIGYFSSWVEPDKYLSRTQEILFASGLMATMMGMSYWFNPNNKPTYIGIGLGVATYLAGLALGYEWNLYELRTVAATVGVLALFCTTPFFPEKKKEEVGTTNGKI
jgi:hypothetical protein